MTVRIISYGGGIQSTAMLVLAAQGKIDATMGGPIDAAVTANVGDDSEHPATLRYIDEHARPFGEAHGIPVVEVRRSRRNGVDYKSIRGTILDMEDSHIPIPIYLPHRAPSSRDCTVKWKADPIARYVRDHGATPDDPGIIAIGISVDEIERAKRGKQKPHETKVYPLLDLGLRRSDCVEIIRDAGLPVPPKSACYFCPFMPKRHWAERRRDEPALFAAAQEIEDAVIAKRAARGLEPAYLTRWGMRLTDAIDEAQTPLFEGDGPDSCDSGYCWT